MKREIEKNDRSEILHDALQFLDDDLIEEVEMLRSGVKEDDCRKRECDEGTEGAIFGQTNIHDSEKPEDKMEEWRENGFCEDDENAKEDNHSFHWRRWTAMAASICLLVIGAFLWQRILLPIQEENKTNNQLSESSGNQMSDVEESLGVSEAAVQEEADALNEERTDDTSGILMQESIIEQKEAAVEIPAMEMELKKQDGMACDMMAFFIYEGRCYIQHEYHEEEVEFVGKYAGTATGLIDEWTTEDGYVDYAGSISGDFYEVKGVDPEFMLCMKWDDGVETYICNNGITLGTGADIIEKYMNLKDSYVSVSYLSDTEREEGQKEPEQLSEEHKELFDRFLDAFSDANFMYTKDIPITVEVEDDAGWIAPSEDEESGLIASEESSSVDGHLYFTTDTGMQMHFRLLEGGYVTIRNFNSICVKIDMNLYMELLDVINVNG